MNETEFRRTVIQLVSPMSRASVTLEYPECSIFDKQLGLERHGCPPGGPFLRCDSWLPHWLASFYVNRPTLRTLYHFSTLFLSGAPREVFQDSLGSRTETTNTACRMLICASQAGSLIGKSGVTIKELKEQSGCSNIKVLQPDDLPPCGLSSDKLLHITGPPESLRRVLQLASTRLRDSPPKEPPSHEPCKNAYPPAPPMGGPPPGYMGGPPPPGYMPPPGAANAPGAPQY